MKKLVLISKAIAYRSLLLFYFLNSLCSFSIVVYFFYKMQGSWIDYISFFVFVFLFFINIYGLFSIGKIELNGNGVCSLKWWRLPKCYVWSDFVNYKEKNKEDLFFMYSETKIYFKNGHIIVNSQVHECFEKCNEISLIYHKK